MKYKAIIAILDGVPDSDGEVLGIDVKFPEHPVPVTIGFDRDNFIGKAVLKKDGDKILAEMELDIDPPLVEAVEKLKPCIGGAVWKREGNTLISFEIKEIGLDPNNSDERIQTLKESKE